MRKIARWVLLIFVFTIPWEYSLDMGAPLGNIARIVGLVLLGAALLAVFEQGKIRRWGALQWLTVALYLWFCCSYFWSVAPEVSGAKLRGYFQEMMLVWLVWEFVETAHDLRNVLRCWLAGSWVLAMLTIVNFLTRDPGSAEQIRFVAVGQDPNDVARFIDLGLPIAALLLTGGENRAGRLLAAGYIPLGFVCVMLTASRSGFVVGVMALAGCAVMLYRHRPRWVIAGIPSLPLLAGAVWVSAPHETLLRLGSIAEQMQSGDLNQRVNIWWAGWRAFLQAPWLGHGAGTFAIASRLAAEDTAHNTVLAILVEGGLGALVLTTAIVGTTMGMALATTRLLRNGLLMLLGVWLASSLVGTTGESRTTWLLLAAVAAGGRLAKEEPEETEQVFPQRFEAMESPAVLT